MKQDLKIFIIIFFILALGMHYKAWMEHPLEQIQALFSQGWFGLHPLVITLIVFLCVITIRGIIRRIRK